MQGKSPRQTTKTNYKVDFNTRSNIKRFGTKPKIKSAR